MTDTSAPPALTGRRVILGVTGGIAAYKAAFLARLLVASGAEVTAVMTPSASRFVGPDTFAALTRRPVHSDLFERPDHVLHVLLGRDADVAVVAPATANVLAKLALGLADDLLTSTLLEASCPLVLAPAMHTGMWTHPATRQHVATLKARGAILVGPAEGPLAAGDEGIGRMAEPGDILAAVVAAVAPSGPLSGRRVLVTAGPTHEAVDLVRYLGNRSSGKMGFALATEIAARGADVTLVTGPVSLPDPHGVAVLRVETAREMAGVVIERFPALDAVVMAAAVADFRPSTVVDGKIKKAAGHDRIELEPTTDILATLGKRKERQVLVGFAAETDALEREGRRKLAEKNLDLVVVNQVGRAGTGFGSDTNRAAILARTGPDAPLRSWTKPELASAVADRLAALLSENPR
ncbi:MAG: bifunctional phosphopantothenoylcysteine decarboxylase/phosphopantothenate--cysteine ligase CoaBC [Actinobacteria bacterium]|nr:bifunctional phosphopantothenoylcysteine decarboxylase/phosphopantothenate--cysteine ligase CoaBC [Actinomycetota bacterium]